MNARSTLSFCITVCVFVQTLLSGGIAQPENTKQPPSLGIQVSFADFKHINNGNSFHGFSKTKIGIAVNYLQGLSTKLDWITTVSGSMLDFTNKQGVNYGAGDKSLFIEGDLSLRRKFFVNKTVFPFLQSGLGGSVYKQYWGAFIPLGAGVQFNIAKRTFILVNAQYRLPLSITQDQHFFYSIGISGVIGKARLVKKKSGHGIVPPQDPPRDTDGDGIIDSLDKCVTVPGVVQYNGCPVPDTDGDGLTDDKDSCVLVAGIRKYKGCPVPDTDGDGVNDESDQCPGVPGVVSNKGCPVDPVTVEEALHTAAKNIFFVTGSYQLKPSSFEVLDGVVALLNKNPGIKIDIEGHTDSQGRETANQVLSEQRANAVKEYLVAKGIPAARLQSFGFGQTKPVANNASPEGRAINRRVEIKIKK